MKKQRILSFITSFGVIGSAFMSLAHMSASAEVTSPLGLKMTASQTEFSLDEIKSGQSVAVYVDVVGNIDESDHISGMEFSLKPELWGKTDPMELILSDPNVLSTDKGTSPSLGAFNSFATSAYSFWGKTKKPTDSGYMLLDIGNTEGEDFVYSDSYLPKVMISSDSSRGFIKTGQSGAGKHLAEFVVNFPKDLEQGKYTINFTDAKCVICPDGVFGSDSMKYVDFSSLEPITLTISKDGSGDEGVLGDANDDGVCNIRDAAFIAKMLVKGKGSILPKKADYNSDGKKDIRDAAAIAKAMVSGKK